MHNKWIRSSDQVCCITMTLSGNDASTPATSSHANSPSPHPGRGRSVVASPTIAANSSALRPMTSSAGPDHWNCLMGKDNRPGRSSCTWLPRWVSPDMMPGATRAHHRSSCTWLPRWVSSRPPWRPPRRSRVPDTIGARTPGRRWKWTEPKQQSSSLMPLRQQGQDGASMTSIGRTLTGFLFFTDTSNKGLRSSSSCRCLRNAGAAA